MGATSSGRRRQPGSSRWAAAALLLLLLGPAEAAGAGVPPAVLVLSSYHQGHAWTDELTAAVAGGLRGVDLHVEHLDARRAPAHEQELFALFARRHGGRRFAALIAVDDAALRFALAHREPLFGGAPIVFCGVNDLSESLLAGARGVTGVVESLSVAGTLDFALRLQPGLRRVVVVNDLTETGERAQRAFESARPGFEGRLAFEVLQGRSTEEVRRRLAGLGGDAAVLLLSFYRDGAGRDLSTAEFVGELASAGPVPVYALWKHYLPLGAVGGVMASGEEQGRAAARLAARIISGEPASAIPVLRESPNLPMADYAVLERLGLDEARLPAGTVVLGRPVSLLQRHRGVILIVTVFLALQTLALVLLARSVVRRRRAERALRESNDRQRAMLAAVPDLLFELDADERIVDFRAPDESLLYVPPECFLGKRFSDVLPAEAHLALSEAIAGSARSGRHLGSVYGMEIDGERRHYEPSVALRRDEAGKPIGYLVLARNVTERVRGAEQRLEMERAAAQHQRLESLGVLAAGIAHDFNNLLCGIFVAIDLASQTCDDAEARDNLSLAGSALDRARQLTRQLLTFATGGGPVKASGDLGTMVRDTATFALSGTRVRARFEFAQDLWPAAFDGPQLAQVVQNLARNAVEAMPLGGELKVSAENVRLAPGELPGLEAGDYVRVSLRDQGCGLAPEVLPHLFEPFFTTKRSRSGMGLATSFSIIKKHGGLLTAEPQPGGAVFSLLLPATAPIPEAARPGAGAPSDASPPTGAGSEAARPDGAVTEARPAAGQRSPQAAGRGTVLVLDDEEMICKVAAGMLASMGFRMEKALTGESALELFDGRERRGERYEICLLDLTVAGGMGGEEVARALRARGATTPLVAMSGYSDSPVIANPSEFGFDAALGKPFRKADLSAVLERLLGPADVQAPAPEVRA